MSGKIKIDTIRPLIDSAFERGETFTFKPNGISMLPFIEGGKESVTICQYNGGAKKFDIVFYRRSDGKYVMHRIVKITPSGYGVCGDNQWWVESVSDESIFAIVSEVENKKMQGLRYSLYCRSLSFRRFVKHVKAYIKKLRHKGEVK